MERCVLVMLTLSCRHKYTSNLDDVDVYFSYNLSAVSISDFSKSCIADFESIGGRE